MNDFDLTTFKIWPPSEWPKTFGKVSVWCLFLVPMILAGFWGVYDRSSLPGVLGFAARKTVIDVIENTRPAAENIHRMQRGNRFTIPNE